MNVLNIGFLRLSGVKSVAYLRREKEIVEMDFPIEKVWEAISKAITTLDWAIEEADNSVHRIKTKTRGAFMSYSSQLTIEAISKTEKTTRVNVSAETPVTTLTGIVDFGRTRERIDSFLMALMSQLTSKTSQPQPEKNE